MMLKYGKKKKLFTYSVFNNISIKAIYIGYNDELNLSIDNNIDNLETIQNNIINFEWSLFSKKKKL